MNTAKTLLKGRFRRTDTSSIGEIPQLNWVIAAFNLSSAAFIPFFGQMADIFGRNASLQASVIIMMLGSALAATAPTDAFPVLLLGRGFQGLGCAGINVIVRVILADKVSLEENAKNWSIFSLTAGMVSTETVQAFSIVSQPPDHRVRVNSRTPTELWTGTSNRRYTTSLWAKWGREPAKEHSLTSD